MKSEINKKKTEWPAVILPLLAILIAALFTMNCSEDDPELLVSSRAYQGHASDADINNFVRTYPHAIGTRLDDCQTCHRAGAVTDDQMEIIQANPCDYCHYILHPPEGWTGLPTTMIETLNPYGRDYLDAGRDRMAIVDIASFDSDGDSHINSDEIDDLRYPGDPGSYPGLELCPVRTITLEEMKNMPVTTQFGLANTTKQQYDYYATYTGVKIIDLLDAAEVDLDGAVSIDVMAPDGYAKTFSVEQITQQYPDHRFYPGLGTADLGIDCAFVEYPDETYGLSWGELIGVELGQEFWHILAYEREGQPLERSYPDPATGRIVGEGPFRNIIPPGTGDDELDRPDRGKNQETSGCTMPEWNYNYDADHNAGSMVKAVVIIRINPVDEGCEEFDIINGGWAMVDGDFILIYGHGVSAD
ncbi:MAG: hypothetical protein JW814_09110 [Candidatus Krumholzibacteriota bacterium]|nr:hypothetical protein [Candidatus Krumholzibacteriota bacterium]